MQAVRAAIQADFDQLNQFVVEALYTDVDLVETIGQYIIDAGGKRIRPILVILCARALNYSGTEHIKLATIIEYIHTATLLHDDVVDLSQLRRGRPTASAEWGNASAVLVGDFIYSRSFQLMVELQSMPIMQLLSETTNRLAAGEVLQLAKAGVAHTDIALYNTIIERKTAILFQAACHSAAILSGEDRAWGETLALYGYHVGMAFQLIDDCLDYSGDVDTLGKPVGNDLAEGKNTLPLILAMQQAPAAEARLIADAISNKAVEQFAAVVAIVRQTSALADTQATAAGHADKARHCLRELPPSVYKTQLLRVADLAVRREV